MAEAETIEWQRIPEEPHEGAPFDGDDYLIYADNATVDIVRLAHWSDGSKPNWARGWWSSKHSVTTEHLDFPTFSHWAHFNAPAEIEAMYEEMHR